jgi:hypothetical protein
VPPVLTAEVDATVSRMLENYRDFIHRFVIGDISADEFETAYLARFKDDPNQVTGLRAQARDAYARLFDGR